MKDMQALYGNRNKSESFVHIRVKGNLIKFMISLVYIELPLRFQRHTVFVIAVWRKQNKLECASSFFINAVILFSYFTLVIFINVLLA